jgi:hypothetical protein
MTQNGSSNNIMSGFLFKILDKIRGQNQQQNNTQPNTLSTTTPQNIPTKNYNITPDVVNTVFSEVGNTDTARESAAMYASIINRANRISNKRNTTTTPEYVVKIPDQYAGRTNEQYKNATNNKLNSISKNKLTTVESAIKDIDKLLQELGDYDSFSKGLPSGVKDYKKIGEHLFYKAPGGLRTK